MTIVIYIILALISLILLTWQVSNFVSIFSGSLYVKTRKSIIDKALKLANLKKGAPKAVFYELGCGNGDVLLKTAKYDVEAVGFEISPYYYLYSKLRTLRYSNIDVYFKNILDVDLSKADVIYCYLLPKFLDKLSPKFARELKPSARLISIGFPINKLKLIKKIKVNNHSIFIYKS